MNEMLSAEAASLRDKAEDFFFVFTLCIFVPLSLCPFLLLCAYVPLQLFAFPAVASELQNDSTAQAVSLHPQSGWPQVAPQGGLKRKTILDSRLRGNDKAGE